LPRKRQSGKHIRQYDEFHSQRRNPMQISILRIAAFGVALLAMATGGVPDFTSPAEAHSSRNWTQAERSRYCSAQAQRHADRKTRRTTAAGALTGAAVGSMVGSNRNSGRNAGRGALVGGSAGLVRSNSRWQSYYNRYYRNCIRW